MYPAGNLFIPAPHGRLEAILKEPRGEGASRGVALEDARAALGHLAGAYPNLPVFLAGFSFGARVGLEVGTRDGRVGFLVGIGTPVGMDARDYDFSFLRECRKPLLLVHGERDEFGAAADVLALAAQNPPEARARVEIIPGAGHFFDGQLEELSRVIREWAEGELSRLPSPERA